MYPPYDENDPRDEYGTPFGNSNPTDELSNAIASIFKQYQPQHTFSDQLSQLIGSVPQRTEPGKFRKAMSALSTLNAPPGKAQEVYDESAYAPYHRAMNDWLAKVKPIEVGAQDERYNNANMRAIMNAQANQLIQERRVDLQGQNYASQAERRTAQTKSDMIKRAQEKWNAENPEQQLVFDADGNVTGVNRKTTVATPVTMAPTDTTATQPNVTPSGAVQTGTPPKGPQLKAVGPIQTIDERGKQQLRNTQQQGSNALAVKALGGSQTLNEIAARAKEARNLEADKEINREKLTNLKAKVDNEFKVTNQTRAMQEGAQMLLPHVKDLKDQATYLAKQGLFGPAMGRIREAAAKIGTTGSPEDIQKSLDEFAATIASDPNLSTDFAVSQFSSNLALMASGMGRVHGGSRGGGSIQMISYMKSVLAGTGSFDDFMGRVSTLNSYLNGYAAGPNTPTNDKMKEAIQRALKNLGAK